MEKAVTDAKHIKYEFHTYQFRKFAKWQSEKDMTISVGTNLLNVNLTI
jgi:hypothetical protein